MDLKPLIDALERHIRPATFPLAIRMMAQGEDYPARTKRPAADLGQQIAICQGFVFSRRYGWAMGMSKDDLSCPLAKAVWGFEPLTNYYMNGLTCAGMYT